MAIDKNMSNQAYHANPAISSSDVKAVYAKSLSHWRSKTSQSKPEFDLGTAVHAMVLEHDKQLVVRGPETRRGNDWKEKYAEAQASGKVLLPESDYDLAENMASALLMHPVGQRMAGEGVINEASFFCHDPIIKIDLKTRPDSYWPDAGIIYDIKTTQDASPRMFARDVAKYNYALQAAFYLYVLEMNDCRAEKFVFACVEKTPPYAVCVHVLSDEYINWARAKMFSVLEQIKNAQETGFYGTGWPEVNVIDLPQWLQLDEAED